MDFEISELDELENEINMVEKKIKELWNNVMVPYLQSEQRQILVKLTEDDYIKFYNYIVKKNIHINKLYNRHYELQNK